MKEQDLRIKIARLEALLEVKQEMLDLLKDILKNKQNNNFPGWSKFIDTPSFMSPYTTTTSNPIIHTSIISGSVPFDYKFTNTSIGTDPYWKDETIVT